MNYRILEIIGPVPLTLEKARKHLNILPDDSSPPSHPDDDVIEDAIKDAVAWVEEYTGRALTPKRYETVIECFPCSRERVRLPFAAPLIDLESIHYFDTDGIEQILSPSVYRPVNYLLPAAFEQVYSGTWPEVAKQSGPIRAVYTAGYENLTLFPPNIMRALKQITAEFFENREDSTPLNLREVSFSSRNLVQAQRLYYRNAT